MPSAAVMDGLQAAHLDLCLISCQGRTGSTCLNETISGEQEKKNTFIHLWWKRMSELSHLKEYQQTQKI